MIRKIRILPPHEALKIAAGEVIERPAHVVKELVENALDAHATTIDIFIEQVGKQRIQVIDNGHGMTKEDALLCFLPHATSKITNIDDLEHIHSFGFRGEALASIAAISKVTLITKSHFAAVDDLGIKLIYTQNALQDEAVIACSTGTNIQVDDLFYTTPVRKKFLKQDETEWNAITQAIQVFCLSYPQVHFRLLHNNKIQLNTPPVDTIKQRVTQLWDYQSTQHLMPLADEDAIQQKSSRSFSISGYISNHQFWRYNRQHIYFFINKRWVKNTELTKSLIKGYLDVLPAQRYPAATIFIDIDAHSIDINIHPKKEEVKFANPGAIQTAITHLVRKTLEKNVSSKLSPIAHAQYTEVNNTIPKQPIIAHTTEPLIIKASSFLSTNNNSTQLNPHIQNSIQLPLQQDQNLPKLIGSIFNTYILFEIDNELVIIDQHAAHERILYEKYQKQFNAQQGITVLFPEIITIDQQFLEGLLNYKHFFTQQGIDFDLLGAKDLIIRTLPPQFKNGISIKEFIIDAAHFIHEHHHIDAALFKKNFNEHLHAQMACKGAVKAGDILTKEQMNQIIIDLKKVDNRFICAHGRPTLWSFSKYELERHFKRC